MTDTNPQAESPAIAGELLDPTPRINLSTAEHIRHEMARVYREARANKLDTSVASRLVYILGQIGKVYELGVIEERLEKIEEAQMRVRRIGAHR